MTVKKVPQHLALVRNLGAEPAPMQLGLFPDSRVLFFRTLSRAETSRSFSLWIEQVNPRLILDLRVVPRFDFPGFTRELAFFLFASLKLEYRDLAGELNVSRKADAKLNPSFVADEISRRVAGTVQGPIVVIAESQELASMYAGTIPPRLTGFEEWSSKVI